MLHLADYVIYRHFYCCALGIREMLMDSLCLNKFGHEMAHRNKSMFKDFHSLNIHRCLKGWCFSEKIFKRYFEVCPLRVWKIDDNLIQNFVYMYIYID